MAVLDSKYEILSQRTLSNEETVFDAVAPDGTALRIAWFELDTNQEELQFERYRQLLRKLERKGLAAIHDIVSRPGTHYVAWYTPNTGWGKATSELEDLLTAYNYTTEHADIRSDKDKGVVYNLGFNSVAPVIKPSPVPEVVIAKPPFVFPDWIRSWSIGLLLSLVGILLSCLGFKLGANDVLVSIPDVVGQNVNQASSLLRDKRLVVSAHPVSSEQPLGTVLATDPPAFSDLRPGRSVQISYAVPPGQVSQVRVPQLGGEMLSTEIQTTLEQSNLQLGKIVYIHVNVPDGIILSQTPQANSQTNEESFVDVLVSLGPKKEKLFVPDLRGRPYQEALDLISLAGLPAPQIKRFTTTHYLPDTVLEQSLAPNSFISQPSVLQLTIASQDALASIGVPSLVGLTVAQARQIAPSFTLYIQEISTPDLPQGIIDQTPPPGPEAGNAITIVVNVAPVPIPQPSPYVSIKEPKPHTVPYRFYIEAGINKNSLAQLIAENVEGKREIIMNRYISEGESIEGIWETIYVGPITFILNLNGSEYARQTVNP